MMTFSDALQQFRSSQWPPRLVSVILVAAIGWSFIVYTLPLLQQEEAPAYVSVPAKKVVKSQVTALPGTVHLFGKPEASINTSPKKDAQVTKLKLTLRGILATTNDPSQGYAQIENAKKEERNFIVKDSIFGQATLEEIYIDRVILLRNGRYETLLLPEEFLNTKHFEAEILKQKQKKVVSNLRNLLVNRKGMELIKGFGFDTAYKNGGFYGFIIKVVGDQGQKMLDTLGAKEGDIVVAVNGERFSESLEAVNNLTNLRTAKKINVEIDRNGVTLFFNFDFDELAETKESTDTPTPEQNTSNEIIEKSDNAVRN